MHDIVLALGIESWKPVITALLLPPTPFLVMVLVGARLMFTRRLMAWLLILLAVLGLWFTATPLVASLLSNGLLKPPPALREAQIVELKRAPKTAIVVLGGGRRLLAPEYGVSSLKPRTMERLRYGLWLARETALPVAFSGGVGHGAPAGASEAEIASRIAEREFNRPLRWVEGESRDTRENALKTLSLLKAQNVEQIVLVTSGVHMPRALRNFQRAAEGTTVKIIPAPMALKGPLRYVLSDWLPDPEAMEDSWIALHEWLGGLVGA